MKNIASSTVHPLDAVYAFAEAHGMDVEVYTKCIWTGGFSLIVTIKVEKDGKTIASDSFIHNASPARFNECSRPRRGGARYQVYSKILEQLTHKSVATPA